MKNTLIAVIKIALFGVFLYNIGVYDLYQSMKNTDRSGRYDSDFDTNISVEERMKRERILNTFVQEKTAAAKKMGDAYGIKEYFTDLIDIRAKEVEMKCHVWGFALMDFASIRDNAWRKKNINKEELEYWQDELEKRYPIGTTLNSERDKNPINWMNVFTNLSQWLLKIYLLTLPLALMLFVIWGYEATGRLKIKSPLRLLLCTLAFPYFFIRQWIATVEMKRTKKYVTDLLSKDEMAEIRAFALGSGRLQEFRMKLQLDGKMVRHSYFKVLIWLLAFNVSCVATFGYTLSVQQQLDPPRISMQQSVNLCQHVNPPPLEYIGWHTGVVQHEKQWAYKEKMKKPQNFIHKVLLLPQEWFKRIDHVPLMNIQSRQDIVLFI